MKIVYWSGTGNTEEMARLIAKGLAKGEKVGEIINVSDATYNIFDDEDIVILGCSAMGDEVLEECEFEPFIDNIAERVSEKKVALFGSYGWGDGKWMRDFEERMESYGCKVIVESLIITNEPDGDTIQECIDFGLKISKL